MVKLVRPNIDIAIRCSHFEESLRFYHDILGLEIVADVQVPTEVATRFGVAPRGFRQVRLRAGDALIKLMEIESPPPSPTEEFAAGVGWLTFFVADMAATYRELRERGARFLSEPGPVDGVVGGEPVAGAACAVDPDGLLIEFVQL